ncbi:MAG: dTDP-glucose 4,6-dehydratase [Alphaproteobacteria bacterium]
MDTILVTGGCGFIGSNFVRALLAGGHCVINLDLMTYSASPLTLAELEAHPNHHFVRGSIADRRLVSELLERHRPRALVDLAAETHVDRSIDEPAPFLATNVTGMYELLEACRHHCARLPPPERARFRLLHVSTDEVFGPAAPGTSAAEDARFNPRSPYSASKAAAEHLVRAWHATYGLPVIVTNCSNNYGPYQFPEKLIPHSIIRALSGEELPLYGDGLQERNWLHVADHVRALELVLQRGAPGESYHIAGIGECTNLEMVRRICRILDGTAPRGDGRSHAAAIRHVADRPGHDRRYALDARKVEAELGFRATTGLDEGLRSTVAWYLRNRAWWSDLVSRGYALDRIGLGTAERAARR